MKAKTSPLKAIRAKCLDCCCGVMSEVRKCTAVECPLHGFRNGHKPKEVTKEYNIIAKSVLQPDTPCKPISETV